MLTEKPLGMAWSSPPMSEHCPELWVPGTRCGLAALALTFNAKGLVRGGPKLCSPGHPQ